MACNPQPDARILDTYIRGINRTLIGASNPPAFIQAQQAISHGQGVPYGVWMSLSPTEQKQIAALNAQATAAAMQAKASAASAAAASAAAARAAATRPLFPGPMNGPSPAGLAPGPQPGVTYDMMFKAQQANDQPQYALVLAMDLFNKGRTVPATLLQVLDTGRLAYLNQYEAWMAGGQKGQPMSTPGTSPDNATNGIWRAPLLRAYRQALGYSS